MRRLPFWICNFEWSLQIWYNIVLIGRGWLVSGPNRNSPPRLVLGPMPLTTDPVTTRWTYPRWRACKRWSSPLPMPGRTLSDAREGSLPFPFPLLRRFLPVALHSASLLPAALLHIAGHLCPPSSPTKPGNCTAVTPSTCGSNHEPESWTNNAGKNRSLIYHLPLATSPSTIADQAPPASPPRRGGLHESVVQPRLHLCCRWPPIHVTVDLSTAAEFLAITPSLWWVPHHQTTLNRSPLVRASSPATPCRTSLPVMDRISQRAIGGESGKEAPVFILGWPVSAQRNSTIFLFPIDLFQFKFNY
jgi:hypothetical protein